MSDEGNISPEAIQKVKQVRTRVKPPLKLCFRQKIDAGRSKVVPFRPKTYVHYVTRKFYTPDYSMPSEEVLDQVKKEYDSSPKSKYGFPVLESHRYGWYSDIRFQDPDVKNDRRLNFPKNTNALFKLPFLELSL